MHRWHERNQVDLTGYYDDLLLRHRAGARRRRPPPRPDAPRVRHVEHPLRRLHRAGHQHAGEPGQQAGADGRSSATWASRNWRALTFARPFNLIYGAGGFSGLLAGLVMSRLIDERQRQHPAHLRLLGRRAQRAVPRRGPGRAPAARSSYTPQAANALADLEEFFQRISPSLLYSVNKTPRSLLPRPGQFRPAAA